MIDLNIDMKFIFCYFKGLRGTNSDLDKQVNSLKRQLEAETLLRIDLENKNKTLREELQFNAQVHETVNYLFISYFSKEKSFCFLF